MLTANPVDILLNGETTSTDTICLPLLMDIDVINFAVFRISDMVVAFSCQLTARSFDKL